MSVCTINISIAYNLNIRYKYEAIRDPERILTVYDCFTYSALLQSQKSRPTDHPKAKSTLLISGNKSLIPLVTGD